MTLQRELKLTSRISRIIMIALVSLSFFPGELLAQIEEDLKGTALASEAPSLRFKQLSMENGLAQSSGNTIMQDKNGFLWISTQGGLHRYDGYEFKVFASVP